MLLTSVGKEFGDFSLSVDTLSVPGPGIYGFIGPNGSGKSTLAKLMAGLLEPDRGSVDTCGLGPRDITYLGRKPYLTTGTVHDNLVYPLRLRNIKPDPELVESSLESMGFSGRGKQKARSLSGGEQQKLAFLRALIFRPRLVILDEAMTAMDLDSLALFENMILEKQKSDPVIWIIISHQMPHVRRLCEYIFFIYRGTIENRGDATKIFSSPEDLYLGQYLRTYGGDLL